MNLEKKIISYLAKYGNTRESDLINYGRGEFNFSSETMKKAIDRMAVKGKIHRIVHNKLRPPEVYISLLEPLPPETLRNIIELNVSETAAEDARKILEEAAAVAEKRIEEREFRESRRNERAHADY